MWRVLSPTGSLSERLPWLTLLLSGLAMTLYLIAGPAADSLVYDRAAIAGGEWWRLVSGHWVHSDSGHLVWNLAAFGLLGSLVETQRRRLLIVGLLVGTIAVDALLWLGLPGMARYCGLSGVLNTLLVLALLSAWQGPQRGLTLTLGAGSLLKIVVEALNGQAILTQTAWPSVPLAHLAGWLAGLMLIGFQWLLATRSHQGLPARSDCTTFPVSLGSRAKPT